MPTLQLWVYDECLASAVSGPLDVFATANTVWKQLHPSSEKPLFHWRVMSLDGKRVLSAPGLPVVVDGKINPRRAADAVLLPGIYCGGGVQQLLGRLDQLRRLSSPLRRMHEAGSIIAANCSAAFLLAEAGLLHERPATTSWWLTSAFRARYPSAQLEPSAVLTERDRLICSGATTAYLNLALRLVERLAGMELAAVCARLLLIDANRTSQAPYMTPTLQEHARHSDAIVLRAQRWIAQHLAESISLEQLARALATSERTLIRRFHGALHTTPTHYVQLQRVEVAKGLLETSTLSVDVISQRVGYADLGSFRKLFSRMVGLTPAAYRARFARRATPAPSSVVARAARVARGSGRGARALRAR